MIDVKNVSKKYKDVILFENLNVKLPENKKILIKGINGSGKSVFLKMLVGYSRADDGTIIVNNQTLGKEIDFIPNAGVMINAPEFLKNMTGMENLLYLSNIRKIVHEKEIMRLVKLFDMEYCINKKYKTYSLGMKQKLRIIQAIMENPDYLILDEPFDALDKKSQELVMNVLDNYIKEEHHTLLFTSHNSEYEKFANIIYELNDYTMEQVKNS